MEKHHRIFYLVFFSFSLSLYRQLFHSSHSKHNILLFGWELNANWKNNVRMGFCSIISGVVSSVCVAQNKHQKHNCIKTKWSNPKCKKDFPSIWPQSRNHWKTFSGWIAFFLLCCCCLGFPFPCLIRPFLEIFH